MNDEHSNYYNNKSLKDDYVKIKNKCLYKTEDVCENSCEIDSSLRQRSNGIQKKLLTNYLNPCKEEKELGYYKKESSKMFCNKSHTENGLSNSDHNESKSCEIDKDTKINKRYISNKRKLSPRGDSVEKNSKKKRHSFERDDRHRYNERKKHSDKDHYESISDKVKESKFTENYTRHEKRLKRNHDDIDFDNNEEQNNLRKLEEPLRKNKAKITVDQLLNYKSVKEQTIIGVFRPNQILRDYCPHITRIECSKASGNHWLNCKKIHYKKVVKAHTDETVGNCSYLNNCFNTNTCKYVHYEIEPRELIESDCVIPPARLEAPSLPSSTELILSDISGNLALGESRVKYPPQWLQCDLRVLDLNILGKFSVIMADPPWDIHMGLPYGTMADDEMRNLKIPLLQDDGYIFLWVTGRAMELGRECLKLWGYKQIEEIVWLKTNQVQSLVRSGRTGHWLNHTKEHCIVGVKGNPIGFNRGVDCDVIVSEVRDTSHKPDEIYEIIERLSPGTRKIELFGRPHNLKNNWMTLGNQLNGSYICEPPVVKRYMAACVTTTQPQQ